MGPDVTATEQLAQVTGLLNRVLGDNLLGACLHGSAVLGDLHPASDLDVLALVRRTLVPDQRSRLVTGLREVSATVDWPRPVELTVVVQSDVVPWRPPARVDFLYGEWLRDELERLGPPQPRPLPDLALTLHVARRAGRTLTGAPPSQLLDPVPAADVVAAAIDGVPALLADLADDTRNVVLTLARIWLTSETAEVGTKEDAAAWALPRLPAEHRPVLEHARALYLQARYDEESWPDGLREQAGRYAEHLVSRLRT
jgi:predicted nucleotidyltransferase